MKVIGRWVICAALAGMAGCAHDGGRNTLKGLERLGRLAEGQRVTVDVYLLDLGADGLAAGFPAAGGNADPKRPVPVANGCPTEDLANLLLRFRDPTPETTSIDGRRATVSGVYHAQETFLDRPSFNAMVYYVASLDDVKVESLHADSCAKWKHTGE